MQYTMAYPPRLFRENTWFHVYARGQRQEPLFFSPTDRIAYLSYLDHELNRRDGLIGSYCLMTNHVHLLVKMESTPLNEIFQSAHMKYAKYFNQKRDTTGHVFQSRPGMKIVLDDDYLTDLVGYIHRNPVEADIVSSVTDYEYSSWRWFIHYPPNQELLSGFYPPPFQSPERDHRFQEIIKTKLELDGGSTYWGTEDQWKQIDRRDEGREGRKFKERRNRTSKQKIAENIIENTEVTLGQLRGQSQKRKLSEYRKQAMVKMYEEGYSPTEIGKWFNRTPGSVLYARNDLYER